MGLAIADVAGKGPSAALLAALIQGMLLVEAVQGGGPAAVISRLNARLVVRHLESRFATLTYCVLSSKRELAYCNAGHNPPVLLSSDGLFRLETGGPILRAFRDAPFGQEQLCVRAENLLIVFTDGITEAADERGQEYGDERLLALIRAAPRDPRALVEKIFQSVTEFCGGTEPQDALTAIVVQFL